MAGGIRVGQDPNEFAVGESRLGEGVLDGDAALSIDSLIVGFALGTHKVPVGDDFRRLPRSPRPARMGVLMSYSGQTSADWESHVSGPR